MMIWFDAVKKLKMYLYLGSY